MTVPYNLKACNYVSVCFSSSYRISRLSIYFHSRTLLWKQEWLEKKKATRVDSEFEAGNEEKMRKRGKQDRIIIKWAMPSSACPWARESYGVARLLFLIISVAYSYLPFFIRSLIPVRVYVCIRRMNGNEWSREVQCTPNEINLNGAVTMAMGMTYGKRIKYKIMSVAFSSYLHFISFSFSQFNVHIVHLYTGNSGQATKQNNFFFSYQISNASTDSTSPSRNRF